WDACRSWTGPGDRLAGLRWQGPVAAAVRGRPAARVRAWFGTIAASFERDRPASAVLAAPEQRLSLLQALAAAEQAGVLGVEPAARAVVQAELELAQRRAAGR